MVDEHKRAHIHDRVRRQHSSELSEDYVEAIYEIKQTGDSVKVSHLQEIFGVSHVTVIKTLQRLHDQKLVSNTKSKFIELTEQGEKMAIVAVEKHRLLKAFYMKIGVNEDQADADAEGAEHHLSEETLSAIRHFLEK